MVPNVFELLKFYSNCKSGIENRRPRTTPLFLILKYITDVSNCKSGTSQNFPVPIYLHRVLTILSVGWLVVLGLMAL